MMIKQNVTGSRYPYPNFGLDMLELTFIYINGDKKKCHRVKVSIPKLWFRYVRIDLYIYIVINKLVMIT